jgi:hypothetical protein
VEEKREEKLLLIREGRQLTNQADRSLANQTIQLGNQPDFDTSRLLDNQPDNQ